MELVEFYEMNKEAFFNPKPTAPTKSELAAMKYLKEYRKENPIRGRFTPDTINELRRNRYPLGMGRLLTPRVKE
jgi:hypothetical protein